MRNWLGVSAHKYKRMPHAEVRAESLWWYTRQSARVWEADPPTADAEAAIQTNQKQWARGRALTKGFAEDLYRWLQELNRPQKISALRERYWTIPAYALAHKIHSKTFCKRFRELEKVAKKLFPDRVPP